MLKCPECGAIVQEEDTCGLCGASLLQARSETLEDILKEEAGKPQGETDPHWKRRALLPPLAFFSLSLGLILSGFYLLFYSQPSRGFTPFMTGFILLTMGFIVLVYLIGASPSEGYWGWRSPRR